MEPAQAITLPSKFDPYIINHARGTFQALSALCATLDTIFKNTSELSIKAGFQPVGSGNIATHPALEGYIIKGEMGRPRLPTTHIYRLRRALKLQKIIDKYGFNIKIPNKFLYQVQNEWYLIAEKLDINTSLSIDAQMSGLKKKTYKPLTDLEVKALAVLCCEGNYDDIHGENVVHLNGGGLAIIDTEPRDRRSVKEMKSSRFRSVFIPQILLRRFARALEQTDRVFSLSNYEGKKEVVKMQRLHFWKHTAKLIAIAISPLILSIGVYFAAALIAPSLLTPLSIICIVLSAAHSIPSFQCLNQSIAYYQQSRKNHEDWSL